MKILNDGTIDCGGKTLEETFNSEEWKALVAFTREVTKPREDGLAAIGCLWDNWRNSVRDTVDATNQVDDAW